VAWDEKILEHLPDITILDMMMPGKAGLEVGTNGKMLLTVWIACLSPSEVGLKHRRHCRQKIRRSGELQFR